MNLEKTRRISRSGEQPSGVSVIICTRNRAESLRRTLESLSKQVDPGCPWEVIVVNNDSHDHTPDVLASFADILPLRWMSASPAGVNIARNAGLEIATGDLLLFTDDDITMPSGWVQAYALAAQEYPQYLIFAGPISAVLPAEAPDWLLEASFSPPAFGHLVLPAGQREFTGSPFGGNFACRREALMLATFDETIGPNGTHTYYMGSETSFLRPLYVLGYRAFNINIPVMHHLSATMTTSAYLQGRARRYALGQFRLQCLDSKKRRISFFLSQSRNLLKCFIRYHFLHFSGSDREVWEARWALDFSAGLLLAWSESVFSADPKLHSHSELSSRT